jgi:hypothetical protein
LTRESFAQDSAYNGLSKVLEIFSRHSVRVLPNYRLDNGEIDKTRHY